MSRSIKRKIVITYWWRCEQIKGNIPESLATALEESTEERIKHMMAEGYSSGELIDNVNMDLPGLETPAEGWDCSGWWETSKEKIL